MPNVKCNKCNKEFYAKPCHIKLGYGKYCSRKCKIEASKKGRYVKCNTCEKKIWRMPKFIKKSKSGKFFCNKSCQTIWRNKYFSGSKHPMWKGGIHSYRTAIKRFGKKTQCKLCNIKDIRLLAVHHLDKNRKNNKKENLIWLCHNCHHLVHRHNIKIT